MPYSRPKEEGVAFLECKVKNQFFPRTCERLHCYRRDFLTYVYIFMLSIYYKGGMMRPLKMKCAFHCCSVPVLFRMQPWTRNFWIEAMDGWMLQPDTLSIINSPVFVVKSGLFGDWRPG